MSGLILQFAATLSFCLVKHQAIKWQGGGEVQLCGGHRRLVHPRSQDSLLPTRHLLISTEKDSRMKWLVEKFSQCVWRAVSAASKRPAIYSVQVEKWCLRVCIVCRELHTNHNHGRNHIGDPAWTKNAQSTDIIHHETRRGPFNTAGATARFDFYAQPRRYSRSAFLAWKYLLVVRAARGTVCFGERHTGRDEILIRKLTPRQQICGGGRGFHNQPLPPPPIHRPLWENQRWVD